LKKDGFRELLSKKMEGIWGCGCQVFLQFVKTEDRAFANHHLVPKNAGSEYQVPALIESEISSKEFRQNWVGLIQIKNPAAGKAVSDAGF
jgi:hypothetical protein